MQQLLQVEDQEDQTAEQHLGHQLIVGVAVFTIVAKLVNPEAVVVTVAAEDQQVRVPFLEETVQAVRYE